MMSDKQIDPFTTDIIKDGLNAIGDETFVSLQRTSKGQTVYEVPDYCRGVTDRDGNQLAQGNGVAGFWRRSHLPCSLWSESLDITG